MYRGTTPEHTFTVDTDLTDATVLYITYMQGNAVVVEKTLGDCQVEADKITVHLSQEETLRFRSGVSIEIQIRAGFSDGTRVASNVMTTRAKGILKDGEI